MHSQVKMKLYPALQSYVAAFIPDMESIPAERKEQLERVAGFVRKKTNAGEETHLIFICTHNSRRSHLSQIWACVAASYYGVKGVKSFSGGTESTAFNPRAVAAIERAGFQVENPGGTNPHYKISFSPDAPAEECFSKTYDNAVNPRENFVAIMNCSRADNACPMVKGADMRQSIPYEDPKQTDDTQKEAVTYDERTKQIATEIFYLFSKIQA